jgi:hypothetical protein
MIDIKLGFALLLILLKLILYLWYGNFIVQRILITFSLTFNTIPAILIFPENGLDYSWKSNLSWNDYEYIQEKWQENKKTESEM